MPAVPLATGPRLTCAPLAFCSAGSDFPGAKEAELPKNLSSGGKIETATSSAAGGRGGEAGQPQVPRPPPGTARLVLCALSPAGARGPSGVGEDFWEMFGS